MKRLKVMAALAAMMLMMGQTLCAQNAEKTPEVTVSIMDTSRTSIYAGFDANEDVSEYYVLRTTPELAPTYSLQDIANIRDTIEYAYGTAYRFTADTTYIYFGRNYPNDSVVLVIAAFSDSNRTEGSLSYFGYRTLYAGGEGVAEVTWTLTGNYSTGFRFEIQPNDQCAYWYMNILDNDTIEANGWSTQDVMEYTMNRYNFSYGFADMGWQGDDYGNEVTVYIFPFNINRELGTVFVQPFRIGEGPLVGLDNIDGKVMAFYPNPAEDVLNVKAEGLEEIRIFSSLGEEVMNGKASDGSLTMDVKGLKAGIYMVNIKTAEGTASRKLIVK